MEHTGTRKYNLVTIIGDIDIILSPIPLCKSKIFIEVKNKLPFYTKKELYKFFNYLREFNISIIPIVIARKIYQKPKEVLLEYRGKYIEINKILVSHEYAELSKQYNSLIANITRVIPDRLIQPDIIKKFSVLKTMNKGLNFSKLDYFEDKPEEKIL